MQTAIIVMTILGCDDNVTQCHYVATAQEHFVSVALCDAASEKILAGFSGVNYPMLVAVCQPPESQTAEIPSPPADANQPAEAATEIAPLPGPAATLPEEERQSLAARAVGKIRKVLPDTADIRMVFETPLHVVADSYSWVAKKISR
ncbi:hypothetical protein C0075_11955 [Rhizobium sp. KAs_5_22]|uniref:hypothetical protein n=1 Tax=Ciceribacter selenitireducens TaxID=448181 RepID=UPI00048E107E|nr:hypothetical protein [Ciceribacter selenitireducens]PPJ46391.1 hypothetical protein C0075_11955 [Rhizobium sp. KAs_5_22]